MDPLSELLRTKNSSDLKAYSVIELEMQSLITHLREDIQFEKFPKKIKDSPKIIHFLETLHIISHPQI